MNNEFTWTELDQQAVDTARILAADAVQKVGNGHPGSAISLAPVAYLLYQKIMRSDPAEPRWLGRDQFILSLGHSSLTQYCQLFLGGYGLELDDLKALRTEGARTPGHPEFGHTAGVECTTGPLGAGVAMAVGYALAARRSQALFDPQAEPGNSIFDHYVYCLAGDGCMQEGVAAEAASLAATQKLGNLILIYDENHISIEGDTKIAFTEDVLARHEAYGWHTQHVDWTTGGTNYQENLEALYQAIIAAQAETERPSIIKLTTVIGWPLPNLAGSEATHGAALGESEVAALKEVLGFDPQRDFVVADEVLAHTRAQAANRAAHARLKWNPKFETWQKENPEKYQLFSRVIAGELPEGLAECLPSFPAGNQKATRSASGEVINAIAQVMPELIGGSADLAGSNNTLIKGAKSFLPAELSSENFQGDFSGRVMHFGVREHAMGSILNAFSMTGLHRAFGGTFLVFADYMRPAVRLAALQKAPSIFVWTHDSVGVGEDGPTHQPIEHVASLRMIPNLDVIRPSDANETAQVWYQLLQYRDRPAALILSRQNLPVLERGEMACASAELARNGGYILRDVPGELRAVIIATGSEVAVALAAQDQLAQAGIAVRVVSMPCVEWFDAQPLSYRREVLPAALPKVAIEAGVPDCWYRFVGQRGRVIGINHFGESANGAYLLAKYGINAENVVENVKEII